MAKEIDIKIRTHYADAVKGTNQVTESYKKLGNQMAQAASEGKNLDEITIRYKQALSNALIDIEQTKEGTAALTAQKKLLRSEMAKVGLKVGENNSLYKEMGQALEEVQSELDSMPVSQKKVSQGFKEMEKTTGNSATKLLSVAKNILKFQLLMGPITSAIRTFKNTLSDSVKVAAEAEQTFSKLATVFEGVESSAKSMARTLSSTIGVASSTAAGALSTVGDLLQAQGMGTAESLALSSEWVQYFQDIIAFKDINMSLEEFAQNFMSGAAGNLRNFRTFGSIVKESAVNAELAKKGLDKLTGSQLELAKMTTRANMALEQQANALGATEREWNTTLSINRRWNEELKTTKELLGEAINEQLNKVKSKATEVLARFNQMQKLLRAMEAGDIATENWQNNAENRQTLADVMDVNYNKMLRKSIIAALGASVGIAGAAAVAAGTGGLGAGIVGTVGAGVAADQITKAQKAWADMIPSVETLLQAAASSGATMEQIAQVIREDTTLYDRMGNKMLKQLEKNIEEAQKLYKDQKAEEKARIERRSRLESAGDSYSALIEAVNLVTGARANNLDIYSPNIGNYQQSDSATNWVVSFLASASTTAIREGFESLMGSDMSTFGDTIEYFLDEMTETDLLQSKQESIKNLFEVAWNQFWADGALTFEESELLDSMKTEFRAINGIIEEINAALERQKNFESAIAQLRESTTNYQTLLATEQTRAGYGSLDSQLVSLKMARSSVIASGNEQKANILSLMGLDGKDLTQLSGLVTAVSPLLQFKRLGNNYYNYYEGDSSPISPEVQKAEQDLYNIFGIVIQETSQEVDNLLLFLSTFDDYMSSVANYYDYMEAERQKELEDNVENAKNRRSEFLARTSTRLGVAMGPNLTAYANDPYASVADLGLNASIQSQINELWDEYLVLIEGSREAIKAAGMWSEEWESEVMTEAIKNMKIFADRLNEINTSEAWKVIEEAWKAIGNRALGSTGTLGSVVQSFQGEGDIWTKIVNAILTILENTENWGQIADILNNLFKMFEPVTDALINLIVSLPWDEIIFVLKVVASAIVIIAGIIQEIVIIAKWLKAVIYNIYVALHNFFNRRDKLQKDEMGSIDHLRKELEKAATDMVRNTEKIWQTDIEIAKNTSSNKDLKVLEDLWSRGIIDTQTYYKEAGSIQGYYQATPLKASEASYVAAGPQYVSISYGDVTLSISGGDLGEVEKVVYRVLSRSDVPYDMPIAVGGYY